MESTATPRKLYRATCTAEFYCHGKTYRAGDEIQVAYEDMHQLREAGLIGAWRRVEVETAVVGATEDASRNYRKRPR